MEPRRTPPEYFLEVFADTTSVRDVLKGTLFSHCISHTPSSCTKKNRHPQPHLLPPLLPLHQAFHPRRPRLHPPRHQRRRPRHPDRLAHQRPHPPALRPGFRLFLFLFRRRPRPSRRRVLRKEAPSLRHLVRRPSRQGRGRGLLGGVESRRDRRHAADRVRYGLLPTYETYRKTKTNVTDQNAPKSAKPWKICCTRPRSRSSPSSTATRTIFPPSLPATLTPSPTALFSTRVLMGGRIVSGYTDLQRRRESCVLDAVLIRDRWVSIPYITITITSRRICRLWSHGVFGSLAFFPRVVVLQEIS